MNLDRFQYVEPKEPYSCGLCPHCQESIFEGDEIINILDLNEVVHEDCFVDFICDYLNCESDYAERRWSDD